jgi:GNAT superfamily N-acetyltransferase
VSTNSIVVRPSASSDVAWIKGVLAERWGSTATVSRGRVHDTDRLPALIAEESGTRCGLATYLSEGDQTELVTLDSLLEGRGIGTALLLAAVDAARSLGSRRLWLITSNDNLHALRFYQKRGLRIVAVHTGAIEAAREIKPEIPLVGNDGIAISDEIELELQLT